MKKQLAISFMCALLMFGQGALARPSPVADIEILLRSGGFSPRVPLEAALVELYGVGKAQAKDGMLYRTYYSEPQRLWVRLTVDTDPVPQERVVSEVLISSVPLAQRAGSIKLKSDVSRLRGIAIGDDVSSLKKLGSAAEPLSATIGNESVAVQRFRPDANDLNFYVDYYLRLDKVVAFAFGLDE